MGLDYSFDLYFRVEDVEKALNTLIQIGWSSPDEKTTVILPDGKEIIMPFTCRFKSGNSLTINTERNPPLDTSLLFLADEPILSFLDPNYDYRVIKNNIVYHRIGMIYLYITCGEHYAELRFVAATSDMSVLFVKSHSIHQRFLELLNAANGILGVINVETWEYLLLDHPERGVFLDQTQFYDEVYDPDVD